MAKGKGCQFADSGWQDGEKPLAVVSIPPSDPMLYYTFSTKCGC